MSEMSTQEKRLFEQGYVTVAYTAELLSVHIATVHRYIQSEKVKATQIGNKYYIKLDSIVEYLGPEASKLLGLTA